MQLLYFCLLWAVERGNADVSSDASVHVLREMERAAANKPPIISFRIDTKW